jgi:hypothetical protein
MPTDLSEDQMLVATLRDYYAAREPEDVLRDLHEKYGETWTDAELLRDFGVQFFDGPRVHVIRKKDGRRGTVAFIDIPRFYFSFIPEPAVATDMVLEATS